MGKLALALLILAGAANTAAARPARGPLIGLGLGGVFYPGPISDSALEQQTSLTWPIGRFALGASTRFGYWQRAIDSCYYLDSSTGFRFSVALRGRLDLADRQVHTFRARVVPFLAAEVGLAIVAVRIGCEQTTFATSTADASAGLDLELSRWLAIRMWGGGTFTPAPARYEAFTPRGLHLAGGVSIMYTL